MEAYTHALRLRMRDAAHSCWEAIFPSDRPSGAYSVYTCVINGGLLVWSFAVVLSNPCEVAVKRWVYAGMGHCFINMIFCVAVIVATRRRIAAGIREETSQWRVCFFNPLIVVYCLYIVWEIVWMISVGQLTARYPRTTCASHLNVQVAFLVFYLLIGVVLFTSTFITERWRRPRWRNFAAMRYEYLCSTPDRRTAQPNNRDAPMNEGGIHVEQDRIGMSPHIFTDHTTTLDYVSIMDDSTTAAGDDLDGSIRASRSRREVR
ncbi:hypothetical protein JKF63_01559 [Porcisia hertigi]|uniref:Transmembrane protein n=1 Tax=Porcisia hertigi TaxID=2761500 RepID=A0A836I3X5_9TRYP|nr:hypothetical protein JKF63_01559 [Porcisia hertigi]